MDNERFKVISTKISPDMAAVLQKVCEALGVDVYHLLQWCIYGIIRAASPQHEVLPDIQKLLTMMDMDAGWQNAFNLCSIDKLKVSQAILILEQEGHTGMGAVMIDRPFMGAPTQTDCADTILERVAQVTMGGVYRRLRLLGAEMQCKKLSEVLLSMIDAQMLLELERQDREEMQALSSYTDNGRQYAYGRKTKSKHHRTPDSVANQQMHIDFGDDDRKIADSEAEGWEGEVRQTEEPPEGMRPFGEEW